MKPTVLLDVDGVVVDFASAFRDFVQEGLLDFRELPSVEVYNNYAVELCMGLSKKELEALDDDLIFETSWLSNISPTVHTQNKITELRHYADIVFVTAPWSKVPEWTYHRDEMLKKHFPGIDRVHTCAKHRVRGDLLVDDKFDTVSVNRGQSWRGVLWTQPWNKSEKWDDRVSNWDDVLRLVRG